jgi:Na+-transporting methylmalonyl-CoA/oxaloacetate decarboxylase gamma subunit
VVTVLVDLGAVPVGQAVPLVVAQDPTPPPGKGEEFGKASPIGLVVILLLLLATVFLVRSMSKHIRRVPASFDDPAEPTSGDGAHPGPDGGTPGPAASHTAERDTTVRGSSDAGPSPDR